MTPEKKAVALPLWAKLAIASAAAGGAVQGGQRLMVDAPVHFAVQGQAPTKAPGWTCAPEGGLFGAPLVCRPSAAVIAAGNVETK